MQGSLSNWEPNPEGYIGTPAGNVAFGGLELLDLRTNGPEHQVPVNLYVDEGTGPKADLVVTNVTPW